PARDDDTLAFAGTDEGEDPMPTPPPPPSEDPVPRENRSADAYPMFWPPPQASVQTTGPLPALRSPQGVTLGEIARQIEAALDETDYYERTYYADPDDFAIDKPNEQLPSA